jgi:hypothetical protein
VQPPKNTGNRQQGGSTTGVTQGASRRNTMDSSSFNQLQQDRLGRQAGGGFRGGGGGGAGRFRR